MKTKELLLIIGGLIVVGGVSAYLALKKNKIEKEQAAQNIINHPEIEDDVPVNAVHHEEISDDMPGETWVF